MRNEGCPHRYYVPDVAVAESEGYIVVVAICVNCADIKHQKIQIVDKGTAFRLQKGKENTHEPV